MHRWRSQILIRTFLSLVTAFHLFAAVAVFFPHGKAHGYGNYQDHCPACFWERQVQARPDTQPTPSCSFIFAHETLSGFLVVDDPFLSSQDFLRLAPTRSPPSCFSVFNSV